VGNAIVSRIECPVQMTGNTGIYLTSDPSYSIQGVLTPFVPGTIGQEYIVSYRSSERISVPGPILDPGMPEIVRFATSEANSPFEVPSGTETGIYTYNGLWGPNWEGYVQYQAENIYSYPASAPNVSLSFDASNNLIVTWDSFGNGWGYTVAARSNYDPYTGNCDIKWSNVNEMNYSLDDPGAFYASLPEETSVTIPNDIFPSWDNVVLEVTSYSKSADIRLDPLYGRIYLVNLPAARTILPVQ
jgi:hypothetical protein